MTYFIECESLNIDYSVGGVATINYVIVADDSDKNEVVTNISVGGQNFSGIITSINRQPIPNTENDKSGPWYTSNVTLLATTD